MAILVQTLLFQVLPALLDRLDKILLFQDLLDQSVLLAPQARSVRFRALLALLVKLVLLLLFLDRQVQLVQQVLFLDQPALLDLQGLIPLFQVRLEPQEPQDRAHL